MDSDIYNSLEDIMDDLELEDERMRNMVNLPFTCYFENGRNIRLDDVRQSSMMRIPLNPPASSHPSDPTLQEIPQRDNTYQERHKQMDFHRLNLQPANNVEIRYKDGIQNEGYQASGPTRFYRSPPRLYSELDLPILHVDTYHKTSYYRSRQSNDLDKLCRKLRKISQNCQDAKIRAKQLESAIETNENALADVANFEATKQRNDRGKYQSTNSLPIHANPPMNKTYSVNLLAGSLPCMTIEKRQKVDFYLQRLDVASQRLPLIGKQLEHVLNMGEDKNIAFEFAELVERRIRICEDQMKRLLRDRCNIPKTKRQIANFEISEKQEDITLLEELLTTLRSQLKIRPSDDYIGRRVGANKHAPGRLKQLQILERSIGQVLL